MRDDRLRKALSTESRLSSTRFTCKLYKDMLEDHLHCTVLHWHEQVGHSCTISCFLATYMCRGRFPHREHEHQRPPRQDDSAESQTRCPLNRSIHLRRRWLFLCRTHWADVIHAKSSAMSPHPLNTTDDSINTGSLQCLPLWNRVRRAF